MPPSSLHPIDLVVIVVYLAAMLGMGFYFMRRQKSASEFLLASHSIGWFAIGLSLLASLNSALDYIVGPASYMQWGLILAMGIIGVLLAFPIVMYAFIPFYMRLQIFNCYEYLEMRFDSRVRATASGIFIIWRICWMAFTIYLPAYALNVVMGIPMIPTIIVLASITTIYTTLGGARAAVWTDVVQALIMFAGLFFAIVIATRNVPGGLTGVWTTASDAGLTSVTASISGWSEASWLERISLYFHFPVTMLSVVIITFVGQLNNYCSDQVMIQRYLSAKSIRDCQQGFFTNAVLYVVYVGLFMMLSMCLMAYFQHNPLPSESATGGDEFAFFFPYFIGAKLPAVLRGLVLVSIYSAAQSSVSSGITAATSVLYAEFFRRPNNNQSSENQSDGMQRDATTGQEQMFFNRVCALVLGIIVTIVACYIGQIGESLFGLANKTVSNFAGVMLPVFLLGMFSARARSIGVTIGALCGVAAMFVWGFGHKWGLFKNELGYGWTMIVGFIVTVTVCYLISFFETPAPSEKLAYLWKNVMQRDIPTQGLRSFK